LNSTVEKSISDIVGCLTDPIVVFPGGLGDTLPEWLKTAITMERMMGSMKKLKGEEPTGTNAEACAYLMAVSLTQPMDSDWTQIYLYVASQTYKRWGKGEIPADIVVDSISLAIRAVGKSTAYFLSLTRPHIDIYEVNRLASIQ
jgi:hypothetical protein